MSNSVCIAELKSMLEDAYAVGDIVSIESIACDEEELLKEVGSDQLVNATSDFRNSFRVNADAGEFFLKRVSDWINDVELVDIEKFVQWLNSTAPGFTPRLYSSRQSETHVLLNGSRFQLFAFVDQAKRHIWMNPDLTAQECDASGTLLAQMHVAGFLFLNQTGGSPNSDAVFQKKANPSKGELESTLKLSFEGWQSRVFIENGSAHQVFDLLRKNEKLLRHKFLDVIRMVTVERVSELNLLTHGDFHPGNILFVHRGDSTIPSRVVDFDHMRWEHPFYDLGYALIMFARQQASFQNQRISWESVAAFINGYLGFLHTCKLMTPYGKHIHSAVTSADPELLRHYMDLACFLIMDWAAERFQNGPAPFAEIYSGIIEMTYHLLITDSLDTAQDLWSAAVKEWLV